MPLHLFRYLRTMASHPGNMKFYKKQEDKEKSKCFFTMAFGFFTFHF